MNSRAVLVNVLVIVLILAGAGAGIYYYNQTTNYVKTDNAQVSGQPINIYAPAAGKLVRWTAKVGQVLNTGERLGTLQLPGGPSDITIPVHGTIVQQAAVPNSIVAAGMQLARAYNFDNLWITANVDETRINDIKIGQTVDVYVDAFSDTVLTGKVESIGMTTAGTFSLLPAANTNSNYTKVTQVVPVNITVEAYKGIGILPGMNASVRIHI